jgi:ribosomal protein S25
MSKTYKKWTKEELEFVANNAKTMKDEEIAQYLNKIDGSRVITVGMVRRQRRKLSIVKPRGRRPLVKNNETETTI